jgi:DNA-binding GntR family transcriptional regulator
VDDIAQGPLESVSLREQALHVVRDALMSGDVRPGEIYSAASLASRLGVSSSPVREAMLTLVNEGLLKPVRNRGFQVVPLSDHDLDEIYEMRVLLEVASIEKIAERGLGPAEPRLRELLEAGESAAASGARSEFLHVDRNFHVGVLELLGNRRLVAVVNNLRDQTRLHGLRPAAQRGQLGVSASEHRTLLEALCRQDVNAAREAMLGHLEHARADWARTH